MLSVVVPTLDEAGSVREVIVRISRALESVPHEIIIVDDASTDGTADRAEALAERYPVRVIRRQGARGLGTAVVAGFAASRGELLAVIDADLSHPPALLRTLYDRIAAGSDIAVGSRLASGGGVEEWPAHRRLLSWFGRLLARPLTPVRDNMSGYFVLRRSVVEGVELRPRGYKILLEILVRGRYRTVEEVPYLFLNRGVGRSKMTVRTHADYLLQLGSLYLSRLLRGSPTARASGEPQREKRAEVG